MSKTCEHENSNASSGIIKINNLLLQKSFFSQSKDIVQMETSKILFDSKAIVQTETLKMH